MDIASISALLTSIRTATDIAKLIKDTDISLEKAETKLKLADLISSLADAKIEAAEIQQTLLDRDSKIRELQEQLRIRAAVVFKAPSYWLTDGNKNDGPYCQQCYDSDHLLVRLQGPDDGYWDCRRCKDSFVEARYRDSPGRGARSDYEPYEP